MGKKTVSKDPIILNVPTSSEANPTKRAVEQTITISWTVLDLMTEMASRRMIIDGLKKEILTKEEEIKGQEKSLARYEDILSQPEIKKLINEEGKYLEVRAKAARKSGRAVADETPEVEAEIKKESE